MAAPTLIIMFSTPNDKNVAVIDKSGIMAQPLVENSKSIDYLKLTPYTLPLDSAINDDHYDCILFINDDVVKNPSGVTLYVRDSGSIEMESQFENTIKETVETLRLKNYNIENLSRILDEVKVDSTLRTIKIDKEGNEENVSSMTSFFLGIAMTFVLYMFLLMYGQMVMTSIIEEKNNRVLELVVSSVRPIQLMLGKILGVGLVAVVQIAIWGLLICFTSGVILPWLMPAGMAEQVAMVNTGGLDATATAFDPDMLRAVAFFTSAGYIAKLFVYMTLFLIGGFLFYASIFAAIGSAVDNVQDSSQLQTFATLPIIVALIVAMSVGNDPNMPVAVWMSMIPFTSPMVMLARIPFDIPSWQIWVSLVILFASFAAMAWIAGKIYRIGIFIYGKKPTIKDLVRWARYK